jgi:hypothetical protein
MGVTEDDASRRPAWPGSPCFIVKGAFRRRIVRSENEPMATVPRLRRRQERKAAELARLLVALDALAGDARPWRPRRVRRASFGGARLA